MTRVLRLVLPAVMIATALAGPAEAQPHGPFGGGGFGGRGFGGPGLGAPAFGTSRRPGGIGARPFAPGIQHRFERANRSHDGRLTQSQAREGNMPVIARHFDEIDRDHKGYVTMDQVQSYRDQMAAKRHAAQGGDAGAADDPDPPQP